MRKFLWVLGMVVGGINTVPARAAGPVLPPAKTRQLDSLRQLTLTQRDSQQVITLYELARVYSDSHPDSATKYARLSSELAQARHQLRWYANSQALLGMFAAHAGNFAQALTHQLAALQIHHQRGDGAGECICENDVGLIYKQMGQPLESRAHFKRALALAQQQVRQPQHDKRFDAALAYLYNNIGLTHYLLKQYGPAETYYLQALAQAKRVQNLDAESTALTNLAAVDIEQKKYTEARQALIRALAIDEQEGIVGGQASDLEGLGDVALGTQQYPAAIAYYQRAIAKAREAKDRSIELEIRQHLPKAYQRAQQFPAAYAAHEAYIALADSLLNEKTAQQIAEMQTKYDTERKEAQNRLQAEQLQTQQQIIRRRNVQLWGGLAVAALLAGLAYLLYTRRRLRREVEFAQERQQLERQRAQAVLEAEEAERRRIGSDLHDGVGQLLTAAKLNLYSLGEELGVQTVGQQALLQNALAVVDESFTEVRSISHNLMPNALIKRGLAQAVREFLDKLPSAGHAKINLEVVGLDQGGRLEPTTENVLFRVIQELVQNILKHAQATEVTLQLIRHPDELTVLVEDNGVGFDPAALGADAGIGLKNIESRMAYLGGALDLDSRPGRGTTVTATVPLAG